MKILIVNTSDVNGGAARAASRLHNALLNKGVSSQMLVQDKGGDNSSVLGPKSKMLKFKGVVSPSLDAIPLRSYRKKSKTLFSPASLPFSNIVDRINKIAPDIVHLHWVNGGMIKIEDLKKIKAPIVWSLHDMWPFTGGCHYDEECKGYKNKCGNCKVLNSDKTKDLSRRIFLRKQESYKKINSLTIIGLSNWLANCAKESALFQDLMVVNIPNPIETDKFKPIDKLVARDILNLPRDKKYILFGAMGATSDPRKGFNELSAAINHLDNDNIELLVFGSSLPTNPPKLKYKTHYLGCFGDDISLQVIYSAADVMVVPSLQENLSNAIMESLSCATPVVGFDIGGNRDMIEHRKNGYLANPYSVEDLACGINWIIESETYNDLCEYSRNKVIAEFNEKLIAEKVIDLYKSILANNHKSL